MRFDGGLLALEGRVVADVEHCRHPLAALYAHPCGVDAVLRHEFLRALWHDVRRGESYSSALLKAVRHAARDRVGVTQAVGRLQNVALSKQTPYERRRHTQPVDVYRRVLHHLHAHLGAVAHIVGEALGAVVPEAVVVAREQQRHAVLLVQHAAHELVRRELRHLRVEVEHLYAVGCGGFKQLHLLVGCGYELWYIVGVHHLARMTVERNDERLSSTCVCHLREAVYHELVSAMYAIEETYCCAIIVSHTCKDTDFKTNGKRIRLKPTSG